MQNKITVNVQVGFHDCRVEVTCPGEITQEEIKTMVESSIQKVFMDLIMRALPIK